MELCFYLSKGFTMKWMLIFLIPALLVVSRVQAGPFTRAEIGELFLFGLPDATLAEPVTRHLEKTCPGSILLFRRNLANNRQAIGLVSRLRELHRKCSDQTLLLGLDQEGGQVARIPFDPPMPSAWALGATKDPRLAEELGFQVGMTLRKLGVNMDLAPVLDLGAAHRASFIGSRSYGSDPETVSQIGSAFSFGLVRARVLPVAKHFPGLGAIPNDPHVSMIRRSVDKKSLWRLDIKPFRDFTQIYPTAIMPSHLIYAGLDPQAGPGTFSKPLLQGLLREKMGFQGLVISDDLLMKGAQESKDFGENVIAALNAGVDLVMVSWSLKSQREAIGAVLTALREGRLSEDAIKEKIARIRKIKRVVGESELAPKLASASQLLLSGSQRYADLTYEILKRNITSQSETLQPDKSLRFFVWPQDIRLKWQIERALHRRVDLGLPKPADLKATDRILAFTKTRKEIREIAAWDAKRKARTLVINQLEPGAIPSDFRSQAQIYLEHPMLGAEIAGRLRRTPAISAQE